MGRPSRKMPKHQDVFLYWRDWLIENDKIDIDEHGRTSVNCFACGMWWLIDPDMPKDWHESRGVLERAHISPHCSGGTEDVSNIHLLCRYCHEASEYIGDREEYLEWAKRRSFRHVYRQVQARLALDAFA